MIRISLCAVPLLLLVGCAAKQDLHPVRDDTWVSDRAGMLRDGGRIRNILSRIHKSTNVQFVVATVEKAGATPRKTAIDLFNTWKLGTAEENNGLLLMLSRDDRAVEIITGKGLDSKLPGELLQRLLRDTVIPQIREGRTDDAIAEAAKQIGGTLRGFKSEDPPRGLLLLLTLFGGVVGCAATVHLYRLWLSPLSLPATGRRDHDRDFRKLSQIAFFRFEAAGLDPKNNREFPKPALLLAWLGLSIFGTGLSGYLTSISPGFSAQEPWFSAVWGIVFVSSTLTAFALQPLEDASFSNLGVPAFFLGLLAAMPAGYVTSSFLSPFVATAVVLPLYALAVNLAAGWYWYSEIHGTSAAVKKTACAKCRSALLPVEPERFLNQWEKTALRDERVGFRAWNCPKCFPSPKSNEQVYLSCAILWNPVVCEKCSQFAVRTVREKKNQQSLVCKACGHRRPDVNFKPTEKHSAAGASSYSSTYESGSSDSGSYSSSYEPTNDYNSYSDPPDSGGSTSGGGASDNW